MQIRPRTVAYWVTAVLLTAVTTLTGASDLRLPEAAKNRDKDTVRALLKQHVDVNTCQPDGATALHWAAHWDDLETANLLIRAGANVNATNDLGVSPLSLASANGNAMIVDKLLSARANPNTTGPSGVTPLMMAARSGSVETVKALLAGGAYVDAKEASRDQTALMWAVSQQHPAAVAALIEAGADVQARSKVIPMSFNVGYPLGINFPNTEPTARLVKVSQVGTGGSTALLFAARQGDIESTKLLLAAGARLSDAAPDGASVLDVAAHSGHGSLATFLLEKGADPNIAGAGHSTLHVAVLRGDLALVKALLAHAANPNVRLTKGTPSSRYGQDFVIPEFLAGATPFYLAATYLEVEIMKALVAGGADPMLPINDGTTPLMAAAGYDWHASWPDRRLRVVVAGASERAALKAQQNRRALEAVKLVVELGADVNARNEAYGDTALHAASTPEVRQFLLEHGAKTDVKNSRGEFPTATTKSAYK